VEFEIRRLSSRPFRGPTVVRLELYVDGQLDRAMTVTVDCRYFRDVVVTTRAVRRGSLLESDAFVVEERDITALKHGWFDALEDLNDLQSARPIGVGEIVSHRHVEPIPVVHRGDDITMAVTTNNMSLEATGIALQDGGVGERIRVRNLDSGKIVYGRVVDASTVRISGS
jgi:flagella basal body P-ring formation protein FlgA